MHLKSCIANGSADEIFQLCKSNNHVKNNTRDHCFTSILNVTNKETVIADWAMLIGSKSLPLSVVEDKAYHGFCGKDEVVSRRTARVATLCLAEMIEDTILEEMVEASQGKTEDDAWTKAGHRCIAIFRHCNKKLKGLRMAHSRRSNHHILLSWLLAPYQR